MLGTMILLAICKVNICGCNWNNPSISHNPPRMHRKNFCEKSMWISPPLRKVKQTKRASKHVCRCGVNPGYLGGSELGEMGLIVGASTVPVGRKSGVELWEFRVNSAVDPDF